MSVVLYMSMSVDGFIAGPDDGLEHGLGVGGEPLHAWLADGGLSAASYRPESGPNATVFDELIATGAVITGRRTFEIAGRWGGDHHDGVPVFVLTRSAPTEPAPGHARYVTDLETCVDEARAAAGDRDVMVHGAVTAQSLLRAGLLDELEIHLVPLLLGHDRRLFDDLPPELQELELLRSLEGPGVLHLRYRGAEGELTMGAIRLDMTMSLDGYVAGPEDDEDNPMGLGGFRLFNWLDHREEEGPHGDAYAEMTASRAFISGRRTYELANHWGGDLHGGLPVFVLTHDVPDDPPPGTIRFATNVQACASAARTAAGEAVTSVLGAGAAQALLNAGELDELELHVVPVLLGQGRRLFDHLRAEALPLELVRRASTPEVQHLRYRLDQRT